MTGNIQMFLKQEVEGIDNRRKRLRTYPKNKAMAKQNKQTKTSKQMKGKWERSNQTHTQRYSIDSIYSGFLSIEI